MGLGHFDTGIAGLTLSSHYVVMSLAGRHPPPPPVEILGISRWSPGNAQAFSEGSLHTTGVVRVKVKRHMPLKNSKNYHDKKDNIF